ncbi:protein RMD5 homolog isoform X2 [Andrographis paniculata]|uniref:protein RMD5 homolog isoform X2 n=1 Tax=Andrographis paniculata TaxID=175694 RepID=UPI0021E7CD8C|nr:protein RMD5 homolog isoform X2 [Andrographis paniculata]
MTVRLFFLFRLLHFSCCASTCPAHSVASLFDIEMDRIEETLELVTRNRVAWFATSLELIDQMCQQIWTTIAQLQVIEESEPSSHLTSVLEKLEYKLLDMRRGTGLPLEHETCSDNHQEILEETLVPNMDKAYRWLYWDPSILNQIILKHFFWEGMSDVADCFMTEANEPGAVPLQWILEVEEKHNILKALELRDIGPALNWILRNKDSLKDSVSGLELKLHKMKYIDMLENGNSLDALQYAQTNISPLVSEDEMQILSNCLPWDERRNASPYSDLVDTINLQELADEFVRVFCKCTEHSQMEHLTTVITAGAEALPCLLESANNPEPVRNEEAVNSPVGPPLEDPLPVRDEYRFHSIFRCEVCLQPCFDANQPMLIPCNHVWLEFPLSHCRQLRF